MSGLESVLCSIPVNRALFCVPFLSIGLSQPVGMGKKIGQLSVTITDRYMWRKSFDLFTLLHTAACPDSAPTILTSDPWITADCMLVTSVLMPEVCRKLS